LGTCPARLAELLGNYVRATATHSQQQASLFDVFCEAEEEQLEVLVLPMVPSLGPSLTPLDPHLVTTIHDATVCLNKWSQY